MGVIWCLEKLDATGEMYRFSSHLLESKEGARVRYFHFCVLANCGRFCGSVWLGGGIYTDRLSQEWGDKETRKEGANSVIGILGCGFCEFKNMNKIHLDDKLLLYYRSFVNAEHEWGTRKKHRSTRYINSSHGVTLSFSIHLCLSDLCPYSICTKLPYLFGFSSTFSIPRSSKSKGSDRKTFKSASVTWKAATASWFSFADIVEARFACSD